MYLQDYHEPQYLNKLVPQCKKPSRLGLGFSMFWLPDLDSNQGPAD